MPVDEPFLGYEYLEPKAETPVPSPEPMESSFAAATERINANGINTINLALNHELSPTTSVRSCRTDISTYASPIKLQRYRPIVDFGEKLLKGIMSFPNVPTGQPVLMFTVSFLAKKILLVNNNACDLLGYTSSELTDMNFADIFAEQHREKVQAMSDVQFKENNIPLYTGKMVDFMNKNGEILPTLLWLKPLDEQNDRVLATAKLMENRSAKIIINKKGIIVHVDHESATVFKCDPCELKGEHITELIPNIVFDSKKLEQGIIHFWDEYKNSTQLCTGKTWKFRQVIPLALTFNIAPCELESITLNIKVWKNVSGLVVIDKDGKIDDCNSLLVFIMFGRKRSDLLGKPITNLIVDFGTNLASANSLASYSGFSNSDFRQWDDPATRSEYFSAKDCSKALIDLLSVHSSATPSRVQDISENASTLHSLSEIKVETVSHSQAEDEKCAIIHASEILTYNESEEYDSDDNNKENVPEFSIDNNRQVIYHNDEKDAELKDLRDAMYDLSYHDEEQGEDDIVLKENGMSEIQPKESEFKDGGKDLTNGHQNGIQEGTFRGLAIHKDGSVFNVDYCVKPVQMAGGRLLHLVWIYTSSHNDDQAGMDSETSSSRCMRSTNMELETSRRTSASISEYVGESELVQGPYGELYNNFQEIGSGAFGVVKIAREKSTGTTVVTKFIEKKRIFPGLLTTDENGRVIPLEVQILGMISHENIIRVLRFFENEHFHILVMEKEKITMDLFDFINSTLTDEPLNCYIFRQVARAIQYLKDKSIIHRDIKDENIIVDECFNAKLIDFGSATIVREGEQFSTFFGTMQYCSPEVLKGNQYTGHPQEIWALGVTLYTMNFTSCPFETVEETIEGGTLFDPNIVGSGSDELIELLKSMLSYDIEERYTIDQVMLHPWTMQNVLIDNYSFHDLVVAGPHRKQSSSSSMENEGCSTAGDITTNNSTTVENYDSDEEVLNLDIINEFAECIPQVSELSHTLTSLSSEHDREVQDELTDFDVDGMVDDDNDEELTDDEVVWVDASYYP